MTLASNARLACGVLALVAAAACSRPANRTIASPGALRGANVLLVTVDTLRQDRVGAYGNRGGLTPAIDRLAARGVRYAHAYSTAPLTLPAHASILTGLLPRHHGIHNNTRVRLPAQVPTLATVLKRAGYRTAAFVGAFVLDGRFGLNQGFDLYDDRLPRGDRASFHFSERRGADVVGAAGDWIAPPSTATASQPWFAWVHLFDPHAPYEAPAEYRAGRTAYDAEVAYADAMLGRLIGRLDAAHILDRTLIVLTADHGESLGEHGETTHGLFAYNSTLAVPLILAHPMLAAATVDTAPASHVDVAPTILDLLGLAASSPLDGGSLLGAAPPGRPLYFEALDASLTRGWAPLRGVIQDGWKYIDLPDAELYDLQVDPGERRNAIDRDPHGELLKRTLVGQRGGDTAAPRASIDPEAAARLRSLGYATGSASRPADGGDDPKRLVALNERFNSALTAFDEGRAQEATAALLAIVAERPDFVAARASAATVLVAAGRSHDAIDLLRAGLKQQPDSPDLLAKLGSAFSAAGDSAAAIDAFERARRSGDEDPDVMNQLAVVLAGSGRDEQARAIFRALTERSPGSATAWFNLGLFELQHRRAGEAAPAFRRAVAIDPAYGDAWNALGAALVDADPRAAIDAWQRAERLLPRDYDLLFNLAMVMTESDRPSDAIPFLQRFAREAPRDRYAADITRAQSAVGALTRSPR